MPAHILFIVKRRWRTILLFVGLGMLVNVSLAWAFAALGSLGGPLDLLTIDPPARPETPHQKDWHLLQIRHKSVRGIDFRMSFSRHRQTMNERQEHVWRFGWPLRSMQWNVLATRADGELINVRKGGLPIPEDLQTLVHLHPADRRLPLQPIWTGFALDTVLFAGGLWLILRGPLFVRGAIRHHRRQCLGCGYPVGASAVCTECGQPHQ